MAIIYTYPTKATLALGDLALISDSADGSKTKNATMSSIKDVINVVDSIAATLPIQVSGSTGDIAISSRAYGGGTTIGHVPAGGTAGNYLDGAGDWSTIDLTTDVNGVLPAGNGGLGGGVFSNGDLVYYTGSAFQRLATSGVTDGFVVTAASGVPTWAAAAGGGSGPGTGTQYNLPIWATTSTLGDSLVTQNAGGTVLSVGTSIASFSTVAGTGSVFATRLAVNGYSTFGGKLELKSPDGATHAIIEGPPNGGTAYSLKTPSVLGTTGQLLTLDTVSGNVGSLAFGNLGVAAGGTGITAIGQYSVYIGTSNTTTQRSSSATGAIQLPKGTEGERPATGVEGMIRYNTESNKLEVYTGSSWETITSA